MTILLDKLVLGCAQFSERYGFDALESGISRAEKQKILNLAKVKNIDTLDTANGYGSSEEVIGSLGAKDFKVNTKLPISFGKYFNSNDFILHWYNSTIAKLKIKNLNNVFFHRSEQLKSEFGASVYRELKKLKNENKISGIGVSVYSPNELTSLINQYDFDIVQIPFNIFDVRFNNTPLIDRLKDSNTIIQVRSIFLQGILLQPFELLPSYFSSSKAVFNDYERELNSVLMSRQEYCVSYVAQMDFIDEIVIGFQSEDQLREVAEIDVNLIKNLRNFRCANADLIDPSKWQLK
jgi:aryl-alcohol dehydrogenase-like predicted oxidoreductase